MTSRSNVESQLRDAFIEIGGLERAFAAEADLQRELGLDSFRLVEILLDVERRLGRSITEDEFAELRTLRDYIDLFAGPAEDPDG